jgi:hypothetical protein
MLKDNEKPAPPKNTTQCANCSIGSCGSNALDLLARKDIHAREVMKRVNHLRSELDSFRELCWQKKIDSLKKLKQDADAYNCLQSMVGTIKDIQSLNQIYPDLKVSGHIDNALVDALKIHGNDIIRSLFLDQQDS